MISHLRFAIVPTVYCHACASGGSHLRRRTLCVLVEGCQYGRNNLFKALGERGERVLSSIAANPQHYTALWLFVPCYGQRESEYSRYTDWGHQ
jgi:hypothetical protein